MSVIVAIKENGVVYMGADSQTTTGRRKLNDLNETAYKITRFENGMLVGFCGRVAAKQAILSILKTTRQIAHSTLRILHRVSSRSLPLWQIPTR